MPMDIYTFQAQFRNTLHPETADSCRDVEQAWAYYKQAFGYDLDGADCQEFGFSVSVASGFDGIRAYRNENLLMIYFGRLIDSSKGQPWQTAEINFYYQFAMTPRLKHLLEENPACEVEGAFCKSEAKTAVEHKIAAFLAFGDEKDAVWAALRPLAPAKVDIQFWIT